jgi:hypothetical protein
MFHCMRWWCLWMLFYHFTPPCHFSSSPFSRKVHITLTFLSLSQSSNDIAYSRKKYKWMSLLVYRFSWLLLIYITSCMPLGVLRIAWNNKEMYNTTYMLDDDGGEVSYQASYSFYFIYTFSIWPFAGVEGWSLENDVWEFNSEELLRLTFLTHGRKIFLVAPDNRAKYFWCRPIIGRNFLSECAFLCVFLKF